MHSENIMLILAIWGAVLSTILAVLKITQDIRESSIKLSIEVTGVKADEFSSIIILIANVWKRPVTIVGLNFGLGEVRKMQKKLYSYTFDPPLKLEESEPVKIQIHRDELLRNAEILSNNEFLFCRTWINIKITSGNLISKIIYLDGGFYDEKFSPRYNSLINTAKYFNRNLESEYSNIIDKRIEGNKIRYQGK